MITLHKPERATYGQAVEAQYEYYNMICEPNEARCWSPGPKTCC